jgi:beta-phosphoglucomutase family hydrolase
MIKAIIFDMDGVIINSIPAHIKAWEIPLSKYGVNFKAENFYEEFQRCNGMTTKDFGKLFKERYNIKVDDKVLSDSKHENYINLIKNIEVFDNVLEFIKLLKEKGFQLAIATSEPKKIVDIVVEKFELNKYFKIIITVDQVEKPKPDPEIFIKAANALGVSPEQCIVIEDSPAGVKAAKSANMKCIAITNTNKEIDLQEADFIINNINDFCIENISKL